MATVPLSKIQQIDFSDAMDGSSSIAKIRNRAAWPEGVYREAKVSKLIGTLDEKTRLAKVLLTVSDPLSLEEGSNTPPLIIDSILQVNIQGKVLKNVVRLNRDYLRQESKVWIMVEDKLSIREVEVIFSDSKYVYIGNGINDGDEVVTTNLSTVSEGAPLRIEVIKDNSSEKI